MSYATYAYYTDTFYGDVLTEDTFDKYAARASDYIDRLTMNKAKDYTADDSVKKACCAAAEQLSMIAKAKASTASENGELASESVGSYSVSYRSGVETAKELEAQLYNIVAGYLAMTGLLYRGIPCIRRIP